MPKANTIQTNFTSGEVSPLIRGRVDTTRYANGAETLENFIVKTQGAAWRRTGTKFIQPTREQTRAAILVPFKFSDTQAYAIEFGQYYAWLYKDGYPLIDTTDTAYRMTILTVANSGGYYEITGTFNRTIATGAGNGAGLYRITTSVWHGLKTGSLVRITGTGKTNIDDLNWTVTYINTTQFDLQGSSDSGPGGGSFSGGTAAGHGLRVSDYVYMEGQTGDYAVYLGWRRVQSVSAYNKFVLANVLWNTPASGSPGNGWSKMVDFATPWTETDLDELYFAQSADVIYVAHPDYAPRKIIRSSEVSWAIQTVVFKDGPYLPLNSAAPNQNANNPEYGSLLPDVYLEVSSYTHTAQAKAATDYTSPGDVNKYLEFKRGDQFYLAQLTAIDGGVASLGTVTVLENVLPYLDETTKLTLRFRGTDPLATPAYVAGQKAMDPSNYLRWHNGTTTICASYANTFGQSDLHKYVRVDGDATGGTPAYEWRQILNVYNNAGAQTGARVHGGSALSMVSNNATGEFILYSEVRSGTVTAKRNGAAVNLFRSSDVGRLIRLGFGGRWTWGKITAFSSASAVTVQFYEDMPRDPQDAANIAASGRANDWRLGAWNAVGSGSIIGTGYPGIVAFHEHRLWFARTDGQPQTMWASVTADFENFQPTELDSTVLDDDGITLTLASEQVNMIRWLSSGPTLLVGTIGSEWQVRAASTVSEPITPSNVSAVQQTPHGSNETIRPVRINSSVIFINRSGLVARELTYSYELDSYVTRDLTVISEHVLRGQANTASAYKSAYSQDPNKLYWVALSDGTLAALTLDKEQEVVAWTRCEIGGSGIVESLITIPDTTTSDDRLFAIVKRTVSGSTRRYVEMLTPDFYPNGSNRRGMWFVDSGITTQDVGSATINGLYHLEGFTVVAVANGVSLGTFTVASGAITLASSSIFELVIGLPYTSTLKTLPPEGGSPHGTAQGKTKRINRVDMRTFNSLTFKHGPTESDLTSEDMFPDANSFFTGTYRFSLKQAFDTEAGFFIVQDSPYPLIVMALMPQFHTNE